MAKGSTKNRAKVCVFDIWKQHDVLIKIQYKESVTDKQSSFESSRCIHSSSGTYPTWIAVGPWILSPWQNVRSTAI